MSDVVGIPGNRIHSFVERIEQIENEIKDLNEAKKEVFSEARSLASRRLYLPVNDGCSVAQQNLMLSFMT
jgi:hypothetical protein